MKGARDILPNLSREEELILCCARTQMSADVREHFHALVGGPLDWKRVAEIATLHRLRPLLYKHFKAENLFEAIPQEIRTGIQNHAAFTVSRNMSLTTILAKTLRLLQENGIEAIPFKGPVLTLKEYGNLALREFYDMDLLLHRDQIQKAAKILLENGYNSQQTLDEQFLNTQLGCEFQSPDGKVRFELHWSFIQKWLTYHVDMDAIWRRAQRWQLAGQPMRILANEDLLLYLCAHGVKHHWERLFWVADIAEIIRAEQIDWSALMEEARARGNWRVLALGLYLAKQMLDAPLPEHVWDSVNKERAIHGLARQLGGWLFHEEKRVVSGDWDETRFYLGARERWADKRAYSKHLLKLTLAPSENDRAFVQLPPGLNFLYPFVRLFRCLVARPMLRPVIREKR
jgi:hypothetical protein